MFFFRVLEWKREVAFQSRGGELAMYTKELFLLMVTLTLHIAKLRGFVSYEGGPGRIALLVKLKNQLEFLLQQKFAEMCLQDGEGI